MPAIKILDQVEVANLENFLKAAKDLEIKGLQVRSRDKYPKLSTEFIFQAKETKSEECGIPTEEPSAPVENPTEEVSEAIAEDDDGDDEEAFDCNICDFRAMDSEDLKQHIVTDHNDKVTLGSDNDQEDLEEVAVKFEKELDPYLIAPHFLMEEEKQATGLSLDTTEKMLYPCDECEYKAARADHLRRHTKKKHGNGNLKAARVEEVKSLEVKSTGKGNIRKSGTFSCDHCSFASTRADNLRRHNNTQHNTNRIKYECNCGVVYFKKENLNGHKLKCPLGSKD